MSCTRPTSPISLFDQGLTVAAWINPDRLAGTQSLVRKRLDGTSSFLLALDGKQLLFILKLTNGRVVGAAAPVQAGRFTHVAATYDGTQAVLYLDGMKVASARGTGTSLPVPARSSSATTPTAAASPVPSTASG